MTRLNDKSTSLDIAMVCQEPRTPEEIQRDWEENNPLPGEKRDVDVSGVLYWGAVFICIWILLGLALVIA